MLKNVKRSFALGGITAVLASLCFLFSFDSCSDNVGLGSAVDTESPKIAITSPSADDVVSGTFTLSGTCSDDIAVSSIPVTIRNTSDTESTSLGYATISEDGASWSIEVNAYDLSNSDYDDRNGWQFYDGTYEVSVIANDASGHSSDTVARSFDIDNTAPVFAITSPNSLNIEDPATYGRSVSVVGEIADDHSIASMDVRLFRYENSVATEITDSLAQSSFSGFDTAGGTSVKIAQFYTESTASQLSEDSDEYKLYQNYLAMYDGAEEGENASLYAVVTLTDKAGNTSDRTFIKSKLSALVKAATGLSSAPETADYKKILNGTYSSTLITDDQQTIIKKILTEDDYDQSSLGTSYAYLAREADDSTDDASDSSSSTATTSRLALSINSDNSPKYEIVGYALDDYDSWSQTGSGSTINIKVTAGLDGTYVLPNTLSVQLYRCSDAGTKYSDAPDYTSDDGDITVTNSNGKSVSELDTSVSTATYIITLPTLKANYYYLVEATGEDEDGNELSSDSVYGFTVTSTGNSPSLEADDKLWVQASALSSSASSLYSLPVTVTDPLADIALSSSDAEYDEQGVTYSITVYSKYISSKNYLSASSSYILYTSDDVTITGSSSIVADEEAANTYTVQIPIAFDLSTYSADNYTVAVTVVAQNSEESVSATYIIWGDNAAPVVTLTNAELLDDDGEITTGGILITENSSFYTAADDGTTTYTIKGKWSDVDGSGTATLYYSTTAGAAIGDGSWTAFSSDDAPQTTDSVKWSDDFTVTEGGGQSFSFYAVDEVGNTSVVLTVSDITFDFAIPVITLTDITTPTASAVTISGTVTDTNAITADTVTVTITAPDDVTAPTVTTTTADDGLSVSYTATVDATTANNGSWTVAVSATDSAGRSATSKSASFVLDTVAPAFQDANTTYPEYVNNAAYTASYDDDGAWAGTWYSSTSLSVSGCYLEELSGVSAVYYQVVSPSATNTVALTSANYTSAVASAHNVEAATDVSSFTTTARDNGIASYSAILSGFEASSTANYLHLVAVDAAGNASSVKTYSIYIDQESPTISCTSHSGQEYTNTVTAIAVSGTATDSSSGIASVTLSLVGSSTTVSATPSTADDDGTCTWTATLTTDMLSGLENSTYNVNATVTDKAGNASASTIFNLQVDTESPTVSMTTPTAGSTINGTVDIQGTVSYDGATPARLALYAATAVPTSSTTLSGLTLVSSITEASSIYSFTFSDVDVQTLAGVTESAPSATLYLIPVVTDSAGNCNVYTTKSSGDVTYSYTSGKNYFTYTVDQNSDRPIIQLTSMDSASSWLTSSTLKGTVTDDDGISSFYISEDGSNYTSVSVSNGSWSYTITSADSDSIPLYFKVIDTTGSTFITAGSTIFTRPYYLYASTTSSDYQSKNTWTDYGFDNSAALSVNLDTANPAVYTLGLTIATDYADYDASSNTDGLQGAAVVSQSPTTYAISASRYAGGDSVYFKVYVPVYDANISGGSVTLSIADASTSTVETTSYSYVSDTSEGTVTALTDSTVTLTATDTTLTVDGTTYTYYETAPLVCSAADSGLKTLTVTVTDAAGNATTTTANFYVDNTGPETITVTSPASTDEITGTTTITGTASDSGVGISNIEWLIPPISVTVDGTAYTNYTDSSTASTYVTDAMLNSLSGWEDSNNTGTASVFKFKFTSGSTYDLTAYDDATNYSVTYDSDKELYTIPVFFRTTDSLGNYYIDRSYYITHNPDGDRPVTEVSYPTDSDYDTNASYITLAGTIRVSGTVEVPSGTVDVGKVYVQIGTVSDSTVTWLSTNSELTSEFSTLGGVVSASDLTSTYGTTTYVDSDWWGIAATTKTSTWNISLNSNGDLDPSSSSSTTNIAIRACAINSDGKMGNWTDTYYIHVDSNAPSQSAEMRQYSSEITSATDTGVTTTKDYASEMYLKGTWYLVVTLSDNDSLSYSSIKVKQGSATTTFYASSTEDLSNSTNGVTNTLYIPIETTSMTSSSVSYTVYAEDSSGHSSSMTYTFYIDNTAPTLGTVSGNGDELSSSTENSVAESNYVYTLSGDVKDTGSGYSKVAFYFLRNGYKWDNSTGAASTTDSFTTSYILDPLVTSWSSTDDAKITFSGLTKMSTVTGETNDVLYAAKATGSAITASTTDGTTYYSFTDTSSVVSGNNHIHAGGLIYAGGAYGLITSVSGSTVTFTSDATPTGETTVYFPYASVVDNTSTEDVSSTTANPFTFSSGDDGDLMPESITNVSTTWTWKATIHSSNIPDGPAYLVVVAYDEAGNVSTATYPVSVTNSAPRLAKLYLGTDLNSDSAWASSEFNSYNVYTADTDAGISTTGYKTATSITTASFDAGQFTAKDKLAVVPEITGGNGSLYMVYKEGATGTTAVTGTTDGSDSSGAQLVSTTTLDVATSTSDSYLGVLNSGDSLASFVLTSAQVWQGLSADPSSSVGVSFTFWDETEERTAGTNSQYCVAYVTDIIIDLADGTAPTNVIDPFYWHSLTDNSIYGSSSASDYADLQGHIELGGGELSATQIPTAISSTLGYGDDPKVSGKIKLTGTAYDDKMLQTIALSVSGISFNSGTAGASFTFATYSGSAWTLTSGSLSGTKGGAIATDGWQFQIDSETLTQSGHTVNWTLYLDTEKHKSVAAKDVTVNASAKDYASKTQASSDNSSTSSTTQTNYTTQTSYYKMDVVPYIAGIKTSLSSLKKANSSVYDRTALGHYPASSSETIYVYGFNLSGGTLYDSASTANTASLTAATASSQTWYSSSAVPAGSVYSVGDISSFTSGGVIVKVNSVQSLNNVNSDSASGSYTTTTTSTTGDSSVYANYYNRQPNGDSNNLLTDDVVLDVWAINSTAAATYNGGTISQPVMSINQVNGQAGFAFVNGPLYYSMGNTSNSYQYWIGGIDFFTSVGFTYDRLGYSYGTTAGGDVGGTPASGTDATTFDQFRIMTSRWGVASAAVSGYNSSYRQIRLENIGQKDWTITNSGVGYSNYANINKERIKSPSIATAIKTSDSTTNVYLAYYDAINDEIRFSYGNFTGSEKDNSSSTSDLVNVGTLYDTYGRWAANASLMGDKYPQPYTLQYTSLIAGTTSSRAISIYDSSSSLVDGRKTTVASGNGYSTETRSLVADSVTPYTSASIGDESYTARYAETSTGYHAGPYVSLAAIEGAGTSGDDVVAVVWYDATNSQMWYSYNVNPSNYGVGKFSYDSSSSYYNGWSTPVAIFGENNGIGKYCKIATDAKGGIHIAAYDSMNGDLYYAYKSSYSATATTCVVDSSGIIGTQISLDVGLDSSGNPIPYIGYYAGSSVRPKVAYWASSTAISSASSLTGAADDAFTGAWEVSLVPTSSSVNDDYVNIGLWKTTSATGLTTYTVPAYIKASSSSLTESTGVSDSGVILGNKTANPLLGYGIEKSSTGYIETAQMQ